MRRHKVQTADLIYDSHQPVVNLEGLIEKHQGENFPDWARALLERLKNRMDLRNLADPDKL
jgi:hypothetical protein